MSSQNIYRQANASSWVVRWYDNRGVKKSKTFNDKKFGGRALALEQAEAFLKITQAELLQGTYLDPQRNKISLADFKHDIGLEKATHKNSTARNLEDIWNSAIAPFPIADMSIGNIKANDIDKHIKGLRKPNGELYSRSYIDKVHQAISVLLEHAEDMDLIRKNPAKTKLSKKSIPKKQKTKKFYLTEFQVKKIEVEVAKTHPIYSALFGLMAYTGLRSGEVRALTWKDIDFEKATLRVNKNVDDDNNMHINLNDPKTDKSIRTLALSQITVNKLKEHKKLLPEGCEIVFPNMRGNQNGTQVVCDNPIRARNLKRRVLKPALERLGYDSRIALHDFRHTSVYLLVKKGASILAISKRLGHASIQITADTYSELFEDVDQDLAKKLDELEATVMESSVARSIENIVG